MRARQEEWGFGAGRAKDVAVLRKALAGVAVIPTGSLGYGKRGGLTMSAWFSIPGSVNSPGMASPGRLSQPQHRQQVWDSFQQMLQQMLYAGSLSSPLASGAGAAGWPADASFTGVSVDGNADIAGKENFLSKLGPVFQAEARRAGLLPSIVMAQAALETGWGKSTISGANNLFGVKWTGSGPFVEARTGEHVGGKRITTTARFRAYSDYNASVRDYIDNVMSLDRYSAVRNASSYREAARALQAGGYATNPNYASLLINIIEQNRLYLYD